MKVTRFPDHTAPPMKRPKPLKRPKPSKDYKKFIQMVNKAFEEDQLQIISVEMPGHHIYCGDNGVPFTYKYDGIMVFTIVIPAPKERKK